MTFSNSSFELAQARVEPLLQSSSLSSSPETWAALAEDNRPGSAVKLPRRPSNTSDGGLSVDMAPSQDSAESSQCTSPLWVGHPVSSGVDSLVDVSLLIHDMNGKSQFLKFQFDLVHDGFEAVAQEMVSDLQLPDCEVPRIAKKIQATVNKEQAKRGRLVNVGQPAVLEDVPMTDSMPNTCAIQAVDLVAAQHHALVQKHLQRIASLIVKQQRRTTRSTASVSCLLDSCNLGQRPLEVVERSVCSEPIIQGPVSAPLSPLKPPGRRLHSTAELMAGRRSIVDCGQRTKVRYCKIMGMYVPDIVKKCPRRNPRAVEVDSPRSFR